MCVCVRSRTVIPNRGAVKFRIPAFLLIIYYKERHNLSFLTQLGCRQIFLGPEGCHEPKEVENHCSKSMIQLRQRKNPFWSSIVFRLLLFTKALTSPLLPALVCHTHVTVSLDGWAFLSEYDENNTFREPKYRFYWVINSTCKLNSSFNFLHSSIPVFLNRCAVTHKCAVKFF